MGSTRCSVCERLIRWRTNGNGKVLEVWEDGSEHECAGNVMLYPPPVGER